MSFRLGRLRIVDLLLFASGALQLHLLFAPSALMVGGDSQFHESVWGAGSPFRFVVLITGVLAVLVVFFGVIRRSAASALSLTVGLVPVGILNLISIAGLAWFVPDYYGWGPAEHYEFPFYLLAINGIALFGLTIASLRSESRGIRPDPSPEATTLTLNDPQLNS